MASCAGPTQQSSASGRRVPLAAVVASVAPARAYQGYYGCGYLSDCAIEFAFTIDGITAATLTTDSRLGSLS